MKFSRRTFSVLACAIVATCAIGVQAEEIIVKNDSITGGGQGVIFGDFVAGEQAGVRLTSPCDGTIVAVQILWLQGVPGNPATLEEAIHIYDGSSFPSPGSELQLLEGPVLTPGFLNEFRYVDEAGTIPINVPVSLGQQFYVALEFANPTDVGGGGASLVRDTSGCQAGKNTLFAIPGGWLNFCLFLNGDVAIRAVIDCPGVTGACCFTDGLCVDGVEQGDCESDFGATWHANLTCAEVTCEPRGACCVGAGCLQLVTPAVCDSLSGVYAGNGANCADNVCVTGACCLPDGTCAEVFEFECTAMGGDFSGTGTVCDPNPCPQPTGACCFDTICVPDQLEVNCIAATGVWGGPFTDCSDNSGSGTADICEGAPSCIGDIDLSQFVDFDDLNLLLAGYGMTSGAAWGNGDMDGDGDVDFDDLNQLLAAYGMACP